MFHAFIQHCIFITYMLGGWEKKKKKKGDSEGGLKYAAAFKVASAAVTVHLQ